MSYTDGIELSKRGPNGAISLERALDRTYLIKEYSSNKGVLTFPKCLIGKRIKIILIDEKEEEVNDNNKSANK